MTSPMASLVADLGKKCDRRTQALHKAIDALDKMRVISLSARKDWGHKQQLIFTICDNCLQQIELLIEED